MAAVPKESRIYPLNQAQPYAFEQWWIGAYSQEVGRSLLPRKILDQPLVFYRTQSGEAVALGGLCPHRLYPLVRGSLQGDAVQCGYHGFTFDQRGRCTRIPSQNSVPPNYSVRRYPTIERGGLVWVWTGKEEQADPALLQDLESIGLGTPAWGVEQHPWVTIKARYQLLIDNLIDLSHISFIHATTIPGGGAVVHIPYQLLDTKRSLNVRRLGKGLPNNPLMQFLFPEHQGPIDQHFDAELFGPHLIRTGGTIYAPASNGGPATELGTTNFIHGITPETPTSVHYYVMTARNFRVAEPAISGANLVMGTKIQPEDIAVLEAIEANVDRFADTRRELSCEADAGAIHVRHRLAAQIRAERRQGESIEAADLAST
jgi:phenylpropionate dioxygenase-like ring-hydroxylating dioxygenase large terminal subunit